MKVPQSPPPFSTLIQDVGAQRYSDIISQGPASEFRPSDSAYLHWEELRRKIAPAGYTNREWWLNLKVFRIGQYEKLPLRDKSGNPFQFFAVKWFNEILHKIDLQAGGKINVPEQITNDQTKDQYLVSSLIEEAITSSQLEGSVTTREVARDMIQSGRSPRDVSERMILNNFLTMREIGTLKDNALTPEIIFHIHTLVTKDTLDNPSASGRLRTPSEHRVVADLEGNVYHEPPPAAELSDRIIALCDFANGNTPHYFIHPVLRAIILHFWLAYDHPFVDGNGRTARALFYWSMLRNGYWLFEFISISHILQKAPVQYATSFLYTETDDNDLNYFLAAQLKVIKKALEELNKYIERKTSETQETQAKLIALNLFNHRQESVLQTAIKHPGQRFAISAHQALYRVSYQTARTDLLELAERNLLTKIKRNRQMIFVAPKDLSERLMELGKTID